MGVTSLPVRAFNASRRKLFKRTPVSLRVLETQEEAHARPDIGCEGDYVLALEVDVPLGYLILKVAHQGIGQGALAGAVGTHDGVNFAFGHLKVHALQDLIALNGNVQILDGQCFGIDASGHMLLGTPRCPSLVSDFGMLST